MWFSTNEAEIRLIFQIDSQRKESSATFGETFHQVNYELRQSSICHRKSFHFKSKTVARGNVANASQHLFASSNQQLFKRTFHFAPTLALPTFERRRRKQFARIGNVWRRRSDFLHRSVQSAIRIGLGSPIPHRTWIVLRLRHSGKHQELVGSHSSPIAATWSWK